MGKFVGSNLLSRGFIYKDGAITNFKVPKAKSTNPDSINDRGVIVGSYFDKKNHFFGFVYKNKKFSTIIHPEGVKGTRATGINNRGLIVGHYFDRASKGHGFIYTKGKFINMNVPGAEIETFPQGINDNNQIVGYFNKSFFGHGFLVTYTPNVR